MTVAPSATNSEAWADERTPPLLTYARRFPSGENAGVLRSSRPNSGSTTPRASPDSAFSSGPALSTRTTVPFFTSTTVTECSRATATPLPSGDCATPVTFPSDESGTRWTLFVAASTMNAPPRFAKSALLPLAETDRARSLPRLTRTGLVFPESRSATFARPAPSRTRACRRFGETATTPHRRGRISRRCPVRRSNRDRPPVSKSRSSARPSAENASVRALRPSISSGSSLRIRLS